MKTGLLHFIESLPPHEARTGELVCNAIEPIAVSMSPAIECQFLRIQTAVELMARLDQILETTISSKRAPIIQIDAHGTDGGEGIVLANQEFVPWADLKGRFEAINFACRLNLLVVMAACSGQWLLEIVQPTDRAPVLGLLGPTRVLLDTDLQSGLLAFHRTLLRDLDVVLAFKAANAAVSSDAGNAFALFHAEAVFKSVYGRYLATQCTEEELERRQAEARRRAAAEGIPEHILKLGDRAAYISIRQHDKHFAHFKDHFFMNDLCAENRDRFPLSFEDCRPSSLDSGSTGP